MDDPLLVRRLERLRDLPGDGESLVYGNRPARDPLVHALAVHELEHEKLLAVGFVEAVDRTDVRMVECGKNLRFAPEPRDTLGIVREAVGKNLQGNVASELRVARAIDL